MQAHKAERSNAYPCAHRSPSCSPCPHVRVRASKTREALTTDCLSSVHLDFDFLLCHVSPRFMRLRLSRLAHGMFSAGPRPTSPGLSRARGPRARGRRAWSVLPCHVRIRYDAPFGCASDESQRTLRGAVQPTCDPPGNADTPQCSSATIFVSACGLLASVARLRDLPQHLL
jgi:hypothetical protein